MRVLRRPLIEDDPYHIVIKRSQVKDLNLPEQDYYEAKRRMFANKDISWDEMRPFDQRPSLRAAALCTSLEGTCYTYSAELKNNISLVNMLTLIEASLGFTRRNVIRLADSTRDYHDNRRNTSCLNIIHYHENRVVLFFRASDMRYELAYDIALIDEFFLSPVYAGRDVEIEIIASTAQNIINPKELIL